MDAKRDLLVDRLFKLVKIPVRSLPVVDYFSLLNYYRIANSFHTDSKQHFRMMQGFWSLAANYYQNHPTNAGILVSMLRFLMHMRNPDALKTHWKTYQQSLAGFTDQN